MSRDKWIDFFTGARIPLGAAKQYAKAFDDNRISTDMLMDLNKDYLRDMGITILGDIIAILKHAKQVQAQLTTENDRKATPPPLPGPPAPAKQTAQQIKPPPAAEKPVRKVTIADGKDVRSERPEGGGKVATQGSNSKVKQRLGPPNTIKFSDTNTGKSSMESPLPLPLPTSSSASGGDIFNRLGPAEEDRPALATLATKRIVISDKRIDAVIDKRTDAGRDKAGGRLPPAGHRGGGGGRMVIDSHHRNPSMSSRDTDIKHSADNKGSNNKKYVLISKLGDGTKKQELLKPNDPRIQQLGVTKKLVVPSGSLKRSASSPSVPARKVIGSPPPPSGGGKGDTTSSVDRKRTRITGPGGNLDSDSDSRDVMREPRPSLQSRLGPKVAGSSSRVQTSSSSDGPVSRARIAEDRQVPGPRQDRGRNAEDRERIAASYSSKADQDGKTIKRSRITFDSSAAQDSSKKRLPLTSSRGHSSSGGGMRSDRGHSPPKPANRKRIQWTEEDVRMTSEDSRQSTNIQKRLGPRISF